MAVYNAELKSSPAPVFAFTVSTFVGSDADALNEPLLFPVAEVTLENRVGETTVLRGGAVCRELRRALSRCLRR